MGLLDGTKETEIIRTETSRDYRFAIFDFDGTLSLIREGWREIMIPMMVDELATATPDEPEDALERLVSDFVDELTGQQTIYQMIRLREEIEARGAAAKDAAEYKARFSGLLLNHIERRISRLISGEIDPADLMVPGSRALLEDLKNRGLELYLASGTDHDHVVREAKLLGIDHYFGEHIYGALENYKDFSKAKVINDILHTNRLTGAHLLGFGDGYVEIENVSAVEGTAVGVATNEVTRSGINQWKRDRLVAAGAAVIIPHYLELNPLVNHLF